MSNKVINEMFTEIFNFLNRKKRHGAEQNKIEFVIILYYIAFVSTDPPKYYTMHL